MNSFFHITFFHHENCRKADDALNIKLVKILQDYRSGRMGLICLQVAPASKEDKGQVRIQLGTEASAEAQEVRQQERSRAQAERAQAAMQTAKERGLELPPVRKEGGVVAADQVGKGQFDGW